MSHANKYEDLLQWAFIRTQRSEKFNFNMTRAFTQVHIKNLSPGTPYIHVPLKGTSS